MTRILGRVPTGPSDFTPEEQLRVVQECFAGGGGLGQGQGAIPGVPQLDDTSRCALEVLGRIPTSRADLSSQEQALIAQRCFANQRSGGQGGDGQRGGPPSGAGVPDPRVLECIVSVIGRSPQSPNDLTNDERRLVGQKCFGGQSRSGDPRQGGQPRGDGPGDLSDEDLQCITNTIGRLPSGPDDLTNDEKRQLGQVCFAGDRGPGDGAGPGVPGVSDLDDATLKCIEENLGRLPLGPDDMTNDEKRLVGQACFGGERGPGGGPDDISEEELQCIVDTIGRLPTGPDDLTDQEKRLVGRACFADEGGPGDLDDETFQCVINTLGRMPSGPEDMTEDERRLVGRTCFAGELGPGGGGDDGPSAEEMRCIIDTIGRQPSGPDDLTQEEKRLIGRACFASEDEGPEDLSEETRQCIIAQLGFLPNSPNELNDDQMDLVMAACFTDDGQERQGARGPQDLDADTQQCIIGIVGSLPENPEDLNQEQKRLIAQQCLGDDQGRGRQQSGAEARGNAGRTTPVSAGMSPSVRRCIVSLVGRVPTASNDLTDSEKRLIGARCFERRPAQSRRSQPGPITSSARPGQTGSGQQPTGDTGSQQTITAAAQPASGQPTAPAASGQQSATSGSGGQTSQPSTSSQQASSGQSAPAAPASAPVAQPAAPSQPALTAVEETIRGILKEHNDNELTSAVWVIDRFSNLTGSKTSGLVLLNKLNHLVIKGKELTVADLAGIGAQIQR